MEKKKSVTISVPRDSNMDLLRIIATLFVIILHYNNMGNGKAFLYTAEMGYHFQLLLLFESFAICAVNVFVLITGFYQSRTNQVTLVKPLVLLVELVVFTGFRYLMNVALRIDTFSLFGLLSCLIPSNWYVAVYIALYLLSPYINLMLKKLTRTQHTILLCVLFSLFSCWGCAVDVASHFGINLASPLGTNGSGDGYTIVNFVMLYCIGAFVQNSKLQKSKTHVMAISASVYLVASLLVFCMSRFAFSLSLSYCNPIVIIQSVALFVFFCNVQLKCRAISGLAKVSFGVYLLHSFFFPLFDIEAQVTGNLILIPIYVVAVSVVIYLAAGVVYLIYQITLGKVIKRITKKLNNFSYGVDF